MNQLTNMAASVGQLLKDRGETVGVSESSTGGLVSAALLSIPGASAYFVGGAALYTYISREAFIGFSLDDHPGVRSASEPFVKIAAATMRDVLGTTWGVAEAGAAGPTGNRYGDDAGHSCIAINGPVERVITIETGSGEREANMWRFAEETLKLFEAALKDAG
ncbi:MAG: CinA family protein [Rhodospirillales bacterium]|jgi:PncC family amidohydrolase|nr:damage-inducible protein [Rhodospirillaceae bacterium]MDP6430316.1 CinA family protein [Rhodospirillales bacterium]MDP6646396.1 CinA family protein [Rhodospirillales bacterium]MDP6841547.1 CinA family protein [Rhodospirillales bacterium]|tara:strand:+ start:278 stop:766 length:489 start_codon:yes stop_codon:yes gene_type:complete